MPQPHTLKTKPPSLPESEGGFAVGDPLVGADVSLHAGRIVLPAHCTPVCRPGGAGWYRAVIVWVVLTCKVGTW